MKYQISISCGEASEKELREFCEFFMYKDQAGLEIFTDGAVYMRKIVRGKPDLKSETQIWRMLRLKDGSFIASGDIPDADDHDSKMGACRISGDVDCRPNEDNHSFEPLEFYDQDSFLEIRIREAVKDERYCRSRFRLIAPSRLGLIDDGIDLDDMKQLVEFMESGSGIYELECIYYDWPMITFFDEENGSWTEPEEAIEFYKEGAWMYARVLNGPLIRLNPNKFVF